MKGNCFILDLIAYLKRDLQGEFLIQETGQLANLELLFAAETPVQPTRL